MSGVLQFIRLISALSLFMAAVWLLIPKGKGEKTARFAVGIFFLFSLVCGAFGLSNIRSETEVDFNLNLEETFQRAAVIQSRAFEKSITALLKEQGISLEKIVVETDILADNSINITKVELFLPEPLDFERAATLIQKQTGLGRTVIQAGR